MTYLSIVNFWKYQNADVWKKSKTHPPWFKHYVHRDRDLDRLPYEARLLFWELLAVATRYNNVIGSGLSESEADLKESEADLKWIWMETRVDIETIREHLPRLISGGWLSQTKTSRRSRELSRTTLEESRDLEEEEEDVLPPNPLEGGTPRDNGTNPRAQRTNPKAKKLQASLTKLVHDWWDEYPDKDILVDELTDRGCRRDEAEDLVATERARRDKVPA